MDKLVKWLENLIRVQKNSRAWRTFVSCLAAIVVFTTTYSLILPAITVEQSATEDVGGLVLDEADPGSTGAEAEATGEVVSVDAENETSNETVQKDVPDADEETDQTASTGEAPSESNATPSVVSRTETAKASESTAAVAEEVKEPVNGEVQTIGDKRIMTLTGEDFDVVVSGDLSVGVSDGTVLSVRGIPDAEVVKSFSDRISDELLKIFVDTKTTEVLYQLVFTDENLFEYAPTGYFDVQFIFHQNTVSHTGEMIYAAIYDYLTDEMILAEKNGDEYETPVIALDEYGIIKGITLKGMHFDEYSDIITLVAGPVNEELKLAAEKAAPGSTSTDSKAGSSTKSAESKTGKTESGKESAESKATKTESSGAKTDSAESKSEGPSAKAGTSKGSETAGSGTLTARGSDYTVTLAYGSDAKIPGNAVLEVTEIENGTWLYKLYLKQVRAAMGLDSSEKLSAEQARFFDITIISGGKEVQPAADVNVSIQYDKPAIEIYTDESADVNASVIHFTEDEANLVETSTSDTQSVEFAAESFSVYGIIYTVNFETVDGLRWSWPGGGSYSIESIMAEIGVFDLIEDATLVRTIDKGGAENALYLEEKENEWYLTSDVAFTDTFELTVKAGAKNYIIVVTDDQDTDITSLLTSVTITENGTPVPSGTPIVKDRVYEIQMSFQENSDLQFVDDNALMYYEFSANVTVPDDSGSFDMDFGTFGTLKGNTYSIENGVLKIHWNTSDPKMDFLRALDEAHFEVSIKAKFGNNSHEIQWNDDIATELDIEEPHEASVSKTGNYDANTGKIYYTVTVNSNGSTTGVKITDEITGSALISDVHSLSDLDIKDKNGQSVTGVTNFSSDGNKFSLNLPDMSDGDQYVIKYSATVDYDKLGKNGKTTYLEANNGVKVEWEESPEPSESNSYEYEINYSSLSKNAVSVSNVDEDGYREITWKVEANGERKTAVDHITDNIRSDSVDIMKMSGDGLTITVTKENGSTETRTIDWGTDDPAKGKLTKTDSAWTYIPPASDGKASYQITYKTKAFVNDLTDARTVNNDVEDDHNTAGGGTSVGPDGIESIVKNTTAVTQEEVEWTIDVGIPARGTNNTRIIDELPHYQTDYYDRYKSYSITGLDENNEREVISFKYAHKYSDEWGNVHTSYYEASAPTSEGDFPVEVYFNLQHKDSNGTWVDGLLPTGEDRNIQIKITTENNEDWLKAAEGNYWTYATHTNTAKFGTHHDGSSAQPSKKIITKSLDDQWHDQVKLKDGNWYPCYKYYLVLQGVSDGRQQIFDTFDTDVFDIVTLEDLDSAEYANHNPFTRENYGIGSIADGINTTSYVALDSNEATLTKTDDGVVISTTAFDKTTTGAYYECYRIAYYLVMKHPEIAAQKAFQAGGKTKFTNNADWDGSQSHVDIEYGNPILDKKSAVDSDGKKATYTITINPDKMKLGTPDDFGNYPEYLTLTDTFSASLSIIYDSIRVTVDDVEDSEHLVEYDYSGNTGSFRIPNEKKVVITYDSNIIKNGKDLVQIWNTANLDGDYEKGTEDYAEVSSSASGGGNIIAIKLLKYKDQHMEDGPLAGATFRILDSEKNPVVVTARAKNPSSVVGAPITFTTDSSSTVNIMLSQYNHGTTLKKNTVYYLEEIEAPPGYQLDSTLYSFVISDDPNHANYTRDDGVWVFYVGDILKIRNKPEQQQLTLYKRFEGNVELTDEQKQNIKFTIVQVDENGNEISGGFRKEIDYSDLVNDKYTITSEEETGLTTGFYKIIEEHADAQTLGLPNNVVAETSYTVTTNGTTETGTTTVIGKAEVVENKTTNVIFVNKYSTGAYYFNKVEAGVEEQPLSGAEFTVYDTDDNQVTRYTTGDDGKFMISRQGDDESLYHINTLYYVMETEAPEGYSIPDPAPRYYFFFGDGNSENIPEGADENNAVNLYEGSKSETIVNASNTSIMVQKVWTDQEGNVLPDSETRNLEAHVTLRRSLKELQGTKVTINVTDNNGTETKSFVAETGTNVLLSWSWGTVTIDGVNLQQYGFVAAGETINVDVHSDGWGGQAFDIMSCSYTPATTYSDPVVDSGFEMSQTLTLADGWYYAWDDLEKTDADGNPYYYYITEEDVPEGYKFKSFSENNTGIQSGTITVTNEKEGQTEFEFTKEWHNVSDQVVETWEDGVSINVRVQRKIGNDGTPETVGEYIITKTTNGFTISGTDDPELKNTSGTFTFKIENLPKTGTIGDTSGEYIYYVTETEAVNGYKVATYSNPPVGGSGQWTTSDENVLNGGKIINKPVDAYELPESGGPGTRLLYGMGIVFVVMAGILLFIKKRNIRSIADLSERRW